MSLFAQISLIAAGGAIGAVSRYLVVGWVTTMFGSAFPYGTLSVNIIGSFFIGIFFVLIVEKLHLSADLRPLIMVGFLGAFTTFSTFSLESFSLIQDGKLVSAVIYVLSSVILCVLATSISIWLARMLFKVA